MAGELTAGTEDIPMTTETTAPTPMIGFDDKRLARASLTYLAEPSD